MRFCNAERVVRGSGLNEGFYLSGPEKSVDSGVYAPLVPRTLLNQLNSAHTQLPSERLLTINWICKKTRVAASSKETSLSDFVRKNALDARLRKQVAQNPLLKIGVA